MNDRELDAKVREAFDEVMVPEDVKMRTLAAIEARRAEEDRATAESAPAAPSIKVVRPKRKASRWAFAIAACLALAVVGFFGYRATTDVTAYVDIDMNPSIGLSLNRFGYVVGEEAQNVDGENVMSQVNVVGMPYADAVQKITESDAFAEYLKDDSFIEFSISTDDAAQMSQLEAQSESCLRRMGRDGGCVAVDAGTMREAHAHGMGAGKYRAASVLAEVDPSVSVDDCAHMTMREIRDRIAACGGSDESGNGVGGEHHGSGGHHGKGAHS